MTVSENESTISPSFKLNEYSRSSGGVSSSNTSPACSGSESVSLISFSVKSIMAPGFTVRKVFDGSVPRSVSCFSRFKSSNVRSILT